MATTRSESRPPTSVLLIAHGGPETLDDVPGFLRELRHGEVPQAALDAALTRYGHIGGGSPMPAAARRIAAELERSLGGEVCAAFKHSSPRIAEGLDTLVGNGATSVTAVCLAPHFSHAGPGDYLAAFREAARHAGDGIEARTVEHWSDQAAFIGYWAKTAGTALAAAASRGRGDMSGASREAGGRVALVFTAHSVPLTYEPADSPYSAQVMGSAAAVARALALDGGGWHVAYQSAVPGRGRWLGPSLDEVLEGVKGQADHVVLAPIGFPCEQVETLYDLDVLVAQQLAASGLSYTRLPTPQDDPALVGALAAAVEDGGIGV
jgi:ferrochelatase